MALNCPSNFSAIEVGSHKVQSILALADCLQAYGKSGELSGVAPSEARAETGELEITINVRDSPVPKRVVPGKPIEVAARKRNESAHLILRMQHCYTRVCLTR